MSNRNLSKAIQNLTREVTRLCRSMTKGTIDWLLRFAFVVSRRVSPDAGIILPTTIMLILVVSLSVGALTYRAYTRNVQVIAQNQQRVITNAASPAIDRARSKLEYLFDSSQDTRYPSGGVPQEQYLLGMMLNDNTTGGVPERKIAGTDPDPYTMPGETRLNLASTPTATDNAWSFRTDTDGDGNNDSTVVYSIIFNTPVAADPAASQRLLVTQSDKQKATQGIVRHGPLTTETGSACQLPSTAATASTSVGWFDDPTNTAVVRKNFQVDVLVVPDSPKAVATTLEFHQDREISKGNKWGAWFRNDLEVFPGPDFQFNGAMHTEGNLIVGGVGGQDSKFQAFLISSKNSCLYPPIDNSEISVTTGTEEDKFKGVIAAGTIGVVTENGGFRPHYQNGNQPAFDTIINKANDTNNKTSPKFVYSDPVAILTADKRQTVEDNTGPAATPKNNQNNNVAPTYNDSLKKRIQFKNEPTPYIDDLSRADDRWGPKSTYSTGTANATTGSAGAGNRPKVEPVPTRDDAAKTGYGYAIPADKKDLMTKNSNFTPTSSTKDRTDENVGLDGYWERRARNEGLRVIVGERLELGNPFGWVTPRYDSTDDYITPDPTGVTEREGDPLYPPEVKPYPVPSGKTIPHLQQQRRTLRDNLAAVQATALYHSDFNQTAIGPDYPFACMASTSHPGTPSTLRQSINFAPTRFKAVQPGQSTSTDVDLLTDFFLGRGTNGWEFEPPAGSPALFVSAIAQDQPLGIALRNLAHFAGDPDGAFPPKQEAGVMHPYPALTMWGNFSNLRRALDLLDSGTAYSSLSIADKTYLQTAACTVGMLAYEVDAVQQFDPTNPDNNVSGGLGVTNTSSNGKLMLQLGTELYELMNDSRSTTTLIPQVLPNALRKQYEYKSAVTGNGGINPRDYYNVPPEAYIEALRQKYTNETGRGFGSESVNNAKIRMAELIMLNFQIRRDRTFGFRPSPSFGHYAIPVGLDGRGGSTPTPETGVDVAVYPSACDPDLFALEDDTLAAIDRNIDISIDKTNGKARQLSPLETADPTDATTASLNTSVDAKITKARLGLSRLCGALTIPDAAGYDLTTGYDRTSPTQARPVVNPKFPALYYIFPEQNHGLNGGSNVGGGANDKIPDAVGEYDTRQPGTLADSVFTTPPSPEQLALGLTNADRESYVIDDYVKKTSVAGSYEFKTVSATVVRFPTPNFSAPSFTVNPARMPLSFKGASGVKVGTAPGILARFPDENRSVFPVADLSVGEVAGKPRELPGGFDLKGVTESWKLPFSTNVLGTSGNNANVPTNIIEAPTFLSGTRIVNTPVAVPFLDKAFFDGRQLMLARTLDLDVGMMRSDKAKLDGERKEPLMPMSGIVYAFREDAVREDAIARQPGARMNARNPAAPTDPDTATYNGVSIKPVDYLPDPERRIHGFRLKNARQVKRDKGYESGSFASADNYRGLSLFTDQPLYVQGDVNRHQTGDDDTIGSPLEEFKGTDALIRGRGFSEAKFYNRGGGGASGEKDTRFANIKEDRWRPTELLADSISIISDNFCDGSISDYFLSYDNADSEKGFQRHPQKNSVTNDFQRNIYQDSDSGFQNTGLYGGLGCRSDNKGFTSFKNSNLPTSGLPTVSGKTGRYDWLRENPNVTSYNAALIGTYEDTTMPAGDYATPVKISRSGLPLLSQPMGLPTSIPFNVSNIDQKINAQGTIHAYADPNSAESNVRSMAFNPIGKDGNRKLIQAKSLRNGDATNINSIVVSGIVPSQPGNTYGGLHNFPRFIEDWGNDADTLLDYAGSFLQLSFSNYSTAPFEMEGWEYNEGGALEPELEATAERIAYYGPPARLWGYDVALQLAPAGPAASRFVIVKTPRNEFYSEPQINDPYIQNLCSVAKANNVPGSANLNCTN
jgi:hypothetical protein